MNHGKVAETAYTRRIFSINRKHSNLLFSLSLKIIELRKSKFSVFSLFCICRRVLLVLVVLYSVLFM